MPYINKEEREELDPHIESLVAIIKNTKIKLNNPNDFKNHLGRINYCFSRILSGVMGTISYSNIAMATGVIENIKQEFYRRLASHYEDKKIKENGDIQEYLYE
jgi:hypothetical protein